MEATIAGKKETRGGNPAGGHAVSLKVPKKDGRIPRPCNKYMEDVAPTIIFIHLCSSLSFPNISSTHEYSSSKETGSLQILFSYVSIDRVVCAATRAGDCR
ncbi:hypothetical protein MLD38_027374 [Melastoma candidum]|uniref:Uncharacterized protein n=1 Tax=Melastoma candidum TaxID=119954 RepID=A0ACB9P1D0_9MYRT|nr:hypothetical protein MLD38_027374 [Melastoma candidum]